MASLGTLTKGDYEVITFAVTNPGGAARNLTNDAVTFVAKRKLDAEVADITKTEGDGISITNAAGGLGQITFDPEDLAFVGDEAELLCSLRVTNASNQPATTTFSLTVKAAP